MFRKTVEISQLSASMDRFSREQKSEHRRALLERIGTAKAEALRRIQGLPSYALDKDDWHRDVERVTPTADDAAQTLAEIQARVKRCRTASDSTPALCNAAQQAQLTAALLLIEIQLDRLIELSRDWQST